MPGITQVQVNEKIDLRFSRVLRAALRQDPDILLVGEMRDQETAEIGLRAALTGHLVLSTLHTRDAATTPLRLIDMGIPPFMVATALQTVIGQRLLRLVCERCATDATPDPQEGAWFARLQTRYPALPVKLRHGRGCSHCNGTGYSGRIGIYELLRMTPPLVDAVSRGDNAHFMQLAQQQLLGQTLPDQAYKLVAEGRSTVSELIAMLDQVED